MLTTMECWALPSRATKIPLTSTRGAKKVRLSSGYPSRNRPSALYLARSSHANGVSAIEPLPFSPNGAPSPCRRGRRRAILIGGNGWSWARLRHDQGLDSRRVARRHDRVERGVSQVVAVQRG